MGAVFSTGVALTPDEFALWLYMDDVYWTEAGRRSMDAVFVALVLTGLLLLGFAPVKALGSLSSYPDPLIDVIVDSLMLRSAAAVAV